MLLIGHCTHLWVYDTYFRTSLTFFHDLNVPYERCVIALNNTFFSLGFFLYYVTFLLWSSLGQPCTDDSECGLPDSVCTSQKCGCNSTAGFEVWSDGGFCTKPLGRL